MLSLLEFVAAFLTAIAMALALAHALELPGKLRLDREHYLTVQAIYYPGFTIGGAAEPLAILVLVALLLTLPSGGSARWLVGGALLAAAATQILFWAIVQPVNRHWLKAMSLGTAGKRFFETGAAAPDDDWTRLRDRWERGHLARTVTATAAFALTILALIAS